MSLIILRLQPLRASAFTRCLLVAVFMVLTAWNPASAQQAPVFVALRTGQVTSGAMPTAAATSTVNPPGTGWSYSAAAQVAGTTWNQILRPNPLIGSGSLNGTNGTFVCNSANNVALTSATGAATGIKLTAVIVIADLEANSSTRVEPNTGAGGTTVLGPTGLMDNAWRIYRGGNSAVFTFTGLTPGARYYLYVYGSTATTGQGCKFTLAAANVPAGGAAVADLGGGNSGNIFAVNSSVYSLTAAGTAWQLLDAVADSSGAIAVTTSKNTAGSSCYPNGFQLTPYPTPTITAQPPPSATATLGSDFSLGVAATGAGTLTYQWQKGDGTNFANLDPSANPSAATATLTLPAVQNSDAATYRVIVSNPGGSVTSGNTALTVTSGTVAPSIQTPPANLTVLVGQAASFGVTANGTSPLAYQWQKSTDGFQTFANVGPNAATFPIASAQLSDAASYRVVVSNSADSVTSSAAALTVNQTPAITAQPVGGVVATGGSYPLTVGASGSPAPTYQWQRSVDGLNFSNVSGGTGASLPLTLSGSSSGFYKVTATNAVGSIASDVVYAGTVSSTLGTPAFGPTNNGVNVNPDTPLGLVFAATPVVGSTGRVRVFDASTNAAVATIDLSQVPTISLGTSSGSYGVYHYTNKVIQGDIYNSQPVLSIGNQPTLNHLPAGAPGPNAKQALIILPVSTTLAYGKTYYVNIDPGVFVDSTGATFAGITDTTSWRFTTKSAGPAAGSASLSVAPDGSGDFTTVQGALDFVPNSNAQPVTINVANGIYYEQVNVKSPFVTLKGQSRNGTIIAYLANNNTINATGSTNANSNVRNVLRFNTSDCTLQNLSVYNLTPNGGSQAEAFRPNGQRNIANHVSLYSYQDTLLSDGQLFLTDSYVEGAVDYMWGGAVVFAQRCELKANVSGSYYTQARNGGPGVRGFAYVNCTLDAYSGVPASSCYLSRSFADGSPFTQTIYVNCKMGTHIAPVGWAIASGTTGSVQLWEYQSKDLNGNALNVSSRASYNRAFAVSNGSIVYTAGATTSPDVLPNQQVSDAMAALFSTPLAHFGNWSPAVALTIDSQPTSQAVTIGQGVTFAATITGAPDPVYQWYKNGTAIPGAANASYPIASASASDYGSYMVVASNSVGSVNSAAASLTFSDPQVNFAASYGLDPTANGAPAADPDNDGVNNQLEFFLGGDPTRADAAILPKAKLAADQSTWTFEFNRRNAAAGVAYNLEYTADLQAGWNTLVVGQNGVTSTNVATDANTSHITITVPAAAIPGDKTKFFMRLRL